jgi:hypothetical protein
VYHFHECQASKDNSLTIRETELVKLNVIVFLPVDSCFDASVLADMFPRFHDYSSVSVALLKSVKRVGGAVRHLKLHLL